jgi:hypothetical protein
MSTLPPRPDPALELDHPVLLAAFEGWNDAGDAATSAVEHLETDWAAQPVAAVDPDDYYDFQVNRPMVQLVDGLTRKITWPTTRVSVCRPPGAERDVGLACAEVRRIHTGNRTHDIRDADFGPGGAMVFRDVDAAVGRAGPDHACGHR